ncbi:hypothetical protein ACEPWQ_24980 (plasmid) [Leclercia adecarboxylata]|uniref:hypothetical protein n=1 Tax=Leclercia adecarboxylata TaxID=83655 RepID=UPI0025AFE822|nr:hypothetical protein [Leclercia adecarboxylata]WJT05478.1 hypothetical protein OCT50_22720 [Leclercia adecarboxylata]
MAAYLSFDKVVDELIHTHGHQELWLAPGITLQQPFDVVRLRHTWRSAKIVKRNGTIVAEQTAKSGSWVLMGDYRTPFQGSCTAPYNAHLIDYAFRAYFYLC